MSDNNESTIKNNDDVVAEVTNESGATRADEVTSPEVAEAEAKLEAAAADVEAAVAEVEAPAHEDEAALDQVESAVDSVKESVAAAAGDTIDATVTDVQAATEAVTETAAEAAEKVTEKVTEKVAEVAAEETLVDAPKLVGDVTAAAAAVVARADVAPEHADDAAGADEPKTEATAEAGETPATVDSDATTDADADDDSEEKRVVRRLAVGQEVEGLVRRITDFGAFVDIGVGRDGLIHISELDVRRVGKVSDVLAEGQTVTAWIKKLDRERNRISLTLVSPDTKTIRDLQKDEVVPGKVTRIVPYGAFIDIGVGRDALLHVREMAEGFVAKPEDVVSEGEEIEVRIIEISRRRGRIDLSLKGLRPEPEAAQPVAVEEEVEEEVEDNFADVEVLSPMELAFRKAMAEETDDVEGTTKKRTKRSRRDELRAIQDEIVARTLSPDSK